MAQYGFPALYVLFLWWFSTGALLFVIGMPRRTHGWSFAAMTALLALALYGVMASSADATISGACLAFTSALLVWAWHEASFLMGFVTGPRPIACPQGASGWERFRRAVEALIYHEAAILLTAILVVALAWGGENQIGVWTFIILWVMRLSAKLNIFMGVPNVTEEFLPPHLEFLKSYFKKKPINLLFPVSVTAATVATALLVMAALAEGVTPFEAAGFTLLATLMALAVLEHWFMVLPLPAEALWTWGLASREPPKVSRDHVRGTDHLQTTTCRAG